MSKAYELTQELSHIVRLIKRIKRETKYIEDEYPALYNLASCELGLLYKDALDIMSKLNRVHGVDSDKVRVFAECCRNLPDEKYESANWCFKEVRTPNGYDFKSRTHEKMYHRLWPEIPF